MGSRSGCAFVSVLATYWLLAAAAAFPQAGPWQPVYHPEMTVSKTAATIDIDGELNDPGWQAAARADGFAEHSPGDQTKPSVETVALMTYDDDNLYVAYVCYDNPKLVRATFSERERVGGDDNIALCIDTYGDATWAYVLNVNPYGIQADALWSPNYGEDGTYDMIWTSAACVTDSGYQVELAIPFSSMRFPSTDEQVWKVDFWRNHPREVRYQYSWAAYDRKDNCWPCNWGTVRGIRGVEPGGGVEILPSFTAFQSGSRVETEDGLSRFSNRDPEGEFGVGLKYAATSDIVVEATYNPDFSQIEADADQIDVNSTFALSYDERRPFFQEGSDLFRTTAFNLVYTRSINDPEFAAKATGRLGRTSLAYLVARDEHTPMIVPFEDYSGFAAGGKSTTNMLSLRQSIGRSSRAGLLVTDRRLDDGGSNTVLSADASLMLTRQFKLNFHGVATRTVEPDDSLLSNDFNGDAFDNGAHTSGFDGESFWGSALYLGLNHYGSNHFAQVVGYQKDPNYRADNGHQPENNLRRLSLYGNYTFRTDKSSILEYVEPALNLVRIWNYDGTVKDEFIEPELCVDFRFWNASTHLAYAREAMTYEGTRFDNLWMWHICGNMTPAEYFLFGGNANYSRVIARNQDTPVSANETSTGIWFDVKPFDRLYVEHWLNYAYAEEVGTGRELYEGYIFRERVSLQVTREISFRLVTQYNDFAERWDVDPLITYRINPFSALYAGSSYSYCDLGASPADHVNGCRDFGRDWKMTSRQFFIKLQYWFQS